MTRRWLAGALAVLSLVALTPPGQAVDQRAVDRAVDRGVAYLRGLQRRDGTWPHHLIGMTALAGLTLLECGVPPGDPAVQQAAEATRGECVGATATYSLALGLLFLDRVGDARDEDLIQSMAIRLLAGQKANGGWTYTCPEIDEEAVRRLRGLFQQQTELVARLKERPKAPPPGKSARDVNREIQKEIARLANRQMPGERGHGRRGHLEEQAGYVADNSNTQFATIALWVARRHGVPIESAAVQLRQRFRGSQNEDGGWGYKSGSNPDITTATMTCAGLLGLAVAFGSARDVLLHTGAQAGDAGQRRKALQDLSHDAAIRRGLLRLGTEIGRHVGGGPALVQGRHWAPPGPQQGGGYYFLWGLERVAVAFGLKTIGNKDWYEWGARELLARQESDGSWLGTYRQGGADTCFALLFLRRANLAKDLTASLGGKMLDPGEALLRAGGVGGTRVQGEPPGLDANNKPAEQPVPPDRARPPAERPTPAPSVRRPTPSSPALPRTDAKEPEADRLRDEFLRAPVSVQEEMLLRLRDGKGAAYTQALADAIPKLGPSMQKKARTALAERMTRMTAATLDDKLRDEQAEIRRAAALAAAMKEDRGHLPRLIALLEDPNRSVARAARVALKSLTGQDLGSDPAAWKAWLKKQVKK